MNLKKRLTNNNYVEMLNKVFFVSCFCKSLPIKPVKDSMVLFEHHLWSSGFQVIEIAKRFQVLVMVPKHLTRIQQNWGLRGPLEEKKTTIWCCIPRQQAFSAIVRPTLPVSQPSFCCLLRTFNHPILGNKSRFIFVAHSWATVFHAAQFVQF